jgi:hypothetical protein
MSRLLRPEQLQWFGLLGAALAWTGQLIVGFGTAYVECANPGGGRSLDVVTWQIVCMVAGGTFAVLAEAAAINVLLATRSVEYDGGPPQGRRRFFAIGAALGNLLFIVAILLSGIAALANVSCRPA